MVTMNERYSIGGSRDNKAYLYLSVQMVTTSGGGQIHNKAYLLSILITSAVLLQNTTHQAKNKRFTIM